MEDRSTPTPGAAVPEDADSDAPAFDPSQDDWLAEYEGARPRSLHDGFGPERQHEYLIALAECGSVEEACRRVGISHTAAYALRRRGDAIHFRRAWEAALDFAVSRIADAAFARALHGTVRPIFYKGEQVGERRHYDERLTMFILRTRGAAQYGRWIDRMIARQPPDAPAALADYFASVAYEDSVADARGQPRRKRGTVPLNRFGEDPAGEPV